jgi:hypothetical protein
VCALGTNSFVILGDEKNAGPTQKLLVVDKNLSLADKVLQLSMKRIQGLQRDPERANPLFDLDRAE